MVLIGRIRDHSAMTGIGDSNWLSQYCCVLLSDKLVIVASGVENHSLTDQDSAR